MTEFLLKTDNTEYLFETIKDALKPLGFSDQFYIMMQEFINHRKVKNIPNDYLQDLIDFYRAQKSLHVL